MCDVFFIPLITSNICMKRDYRKTEFCELGPNHPKDLFKILLISNPPINPIILLIWKIYNIYIAHIAFDISRHILSVSYHTRT